MVNWHGVWRRTRGRDASLQNYHVRSPGEERDQTADEGVAEALRRDAELDANPEAGLTLEQLDERIRDRRR